MCYILFVFRVDVVVVVVFFIDLHECIGSWNLGHEDDNATCRFYK